MSEDRKGDDAIGTDSVTDLDEVDDLVKERFDDHSKDPSKEPKTDPRLVKDSMARGETPVRALGISTCENVLHHPLLQGGGAHPLSSVAGVDSFGRRNGNTIHGGADGCVDLPIPDPPSLQSSSSVASGVFHSNRSRKRPFSIESDHYRGSYGVNNEQLGMADGGAERAQLCALRKRVVTLPLVRRVDDLPDVRNADATRTLPPREGSRFVDDQKGATRPANRRRRTEIRRICTMLSNARIDDTQPPVKRPCSMVGRGTDRLVTTDGEEIDDEEVEVDAETPISDMPAMRRSYRDDDNDFDGPPSLGEGQAV